MAKNKNSVKTSFVFAILLTGCFFGKQTSEVKYELNLDSGWRTASLFNDKLKVSVPKKLPAMPVMKMISSYSSEIYTVDDAGSTYSVSRSLVTEGSELYTSGGSEREKQAAINFILMSARTEVLRQVQGKEQNVESTTLNGFACQTFQFSAGANSGEGKFCLVKSALYGVVALGPAGSSFKSRCLDTMSVRE